MKETFNPEQDFFKLGKQLQSTCEQLQAMQEQKARLNEEVAAARRALTVSREKLRERKSAHKVLNEERTNSEKRALKQTNSNLIRGHKVESTGNMVAALREELAILEVEVHESQQLLEHETAQRDFLVDIIQSAQRELLAQQHDRDLYRKQALEMKRRATNRAAHLANFKQANFILLDTLVLD